MRQWESKGTSTAKPHRFLSGHQFLASDAHWGGKKLFSTCSEYRISNLYIYHKNQPRVGIQHGYLMDPMGWGSHSPPQMFGFLGYLHAVPPKCLGKKGNGGEYGTVRVRLGEVPAAGSVFSPEKLTAGTWKSPKWQGKSSSKILLVWIPCYW